jgi:hypothetical protein
MKIVFNKYHSGKEIVKALSSILKYKTKVLVKTEAFDEKHGIVSETVKVHLTSLSPDFCVSPNADYHIFIVIDNIILTCKYYLINMEINYIRNNGVLKITLVNDNNGNKTDLAKSIEAVIRQFLENLYRKPKTDNITADDATELGVALEV